jgi:hypothetical protein
VSPAPAIWSPHLQPGERIVWSASASQEMRRAEMSRHRLLYGAAGLVSLAIAIALGVRFAESLLIVTAQPSMLAVFTPLYIVFALAMGALALWGLRRMGDRPPVAIHYALTGSRLLALDAGGAIVSQMQGADVAGVIAGGRRKTPDVYVLRKDDPKEDHAFAIEHVERPLEAKAIIEETLLPEPTGDAPA